MGRTEQLMNSERWLLLAGLGLTLALLYLLAPILTPFMVAAILAYMGDPLVDRFDARGFSRTTGVTVVFAVIVLVLLIATLVVLPRLEQQLTRLVLALPGYVEVLHGRLNTLLIAQLGVSADLLELDNLKAMAMERWSSMSKVAGTVAQSVFSSGMTIVAWVMNLLLIPVVAFYMLRDWDIIVGRLHELIPRRWAPEVARLARSSDEVLGAFLRGQLLVMLSLGLIYSVGLGLVGLEFALLIGMAAGVLSFVPYLGAIGGLLMAGLAAYLQFNDWPHFLAVLAVFGVGQLLEGMVLTPKLVGDRIGLHPVAVIFAVMAGGQLFGFFGVLLALPVAAVIMVLLRYAHERYVSSDLYTQ